MEETDAGLRLKVPKTKGSIRTIKPPNSTVELLRAQHRQQTEFRLQVGIGGRPGSQDLVFTLPDGRPYPPDQLSAAWGLMLKARGLPQVRFHALRHTHASALIAAGLDVVTISKRLGHGSPAITLQVYAHLFNRQTDNAAADAIERALGGG
jgi:integrase